MLLVVVISRNIKQKDQKTGLNQSQLLWATICNQLCMVWLQSKQFVKFPQPVAVQSPPKRGKRPDQTRL